MRPRAGPVRLVLAALLSPGPRGSTAAFSAACSLLGGRHEPSFLARPFLTSCCCRWLAAASVRESLPWPGFLTCPVSVLVQGWKPLLLCVSVRGHWVSEEGAHPCWLGGCRALTSPHHQRELSPTAKGRSWRAGGLPGLPGGAAGPARAGAPPLPGKLPGTRGSPTGRML